MVLGPAGKLFVSWRSALSAPPSGYYELAAVGEVLATPALVIWL
jgi:hypothetical protein